MKEFEKEIRMEVKDKIVKEFGSFDIRVHRAIKLTQQKTVQSIFDEYCKQCVYNELPNKETKQFNKKEFYCKHCWFKKKLKKEWGCK